MKTIGELEVQSRLAIIAYLSDMNNVKLEFAAISDRPNSMRWSESNGKVNMNCCYYRIAPKKLWYKVALCYGSGKYYTTTADSKAQIQHYESKNDFIEWITPDKVYYTIKEK